MFLLHSSLIQKCLRLKNVYFEHWVLFGVLSFLFSIPFVNCWLLLFIEKMKEKKNVCWLYWWEDVLTNVCKLISFCFCQFIKIFILKSSSFLVCRNGNLHLLFFSLYNWDKEDLKICLFHCFQHHVKLPLKLLEETTTSSQIITSRTTLIFLWLPRKFQTLRNWSKTEIIFNSKIYRSSFLCFFILLYCQTLFKLFHLINDF